MTLFQIKIIAVLTMVIDHVGMLFFPEHEWLRLIGRISFPLFAWAIANGYHYTKSVSAYMRRLALLAVVSQIPYYLIFGMLYNMPYRLNIFVTLALGLLAIHVFETVRNTPIKWGLLSTFALLGVFLPTGYGIYGLVLIFLFHLTYRDRAHLVFVQTLFMVGTVLFWMSFVSMLPLQWQIMIPGVTLIQLGAVFSLPIIYAYNKKLGNTNAKWWFYWFYPAHLFILWVLYAFG